MNKEKASPSSSFPSVHHAAQSSSTGEFNADPQGLLVPDGEGVASLLPTYNRQRDVTTDGCHSDMALKERDPSPPFLSRLCQIWNKASAEPSVSPEPSSYSRHQDSRKDSTKEDIDADERTRYTHAACTHDVSPSPVEGRELNGSMRIQPQRRGSDEREHDMFVQAMCMNSEDRAGEETNGSLLDDAEAEIYSAYGNRNNSEEYGREQIENNRHEGREAQERLSYRERRKEKHQIVRHRDSKDAQQRFLLTLGRAFLTFGSPSHRIEPQLTTLSKLFMLDIQFVHTPGCIQFTFGIPEKHLSETVLVKAATASEGLDLGRIHETHTVYRAVVRDEMSASEGHRRLEALLGRAPLYPRVVMYGLAFVQGFLMCGAFFGGSLNDMWAAGILSVGVSVAQSGASKSELSSSGSNVCIAAVVSFIARALAVGIPNQVFCYGAISSTSVTGLLPGAIMLAGVLDIASKNIYLGSPKVVAGIMTSLYLGFGLTLGSDLWLSFDSRGRREVESTTSDNKIEIFLGTFFSTNETQTLPEWATSAALTGVWRFEETNDPSSDDTVAAVVQGCVRKPDWPWTLQPLPWYALIIVLPLLNLVLALGRSQPLRDRQTPAIVLIGCASTATTALSNAFLGLGGHPDYVALLGSAVVSALGNAYARWFGGTAFTAIVSGILVLIPTGLADAGGLANRNVGLGSEEDEYTRTLQLARKMLSVIIGVMAGVYLSARIVYAVGKTKNRAFMTF